MKYNGSVRQHSALIKKILTDNLIAPSQVWTLMACLPSALKEHCLVSKRAIHVESASPHKEKK